MKMFNSLLISLAITLLGTACGDDSSDPTDTGMDAEVVDDTPEEDAGPTTFVCGTTTCNEPTIDTSGLPEVIRALAESMPDLISTLLTVQGCCVEGGDNVCGVMGDMGCLEQSMPGELDEACPPVNVDVMGMAIELGGCCKPTGMCGFDFGVLGIGCLEREEAAMMTTMGMTLPDAGLIMSVSCGDSGDDAGAGADAGK